MEGSRMKERHLTFARWTENSISLCNNFDILVACVYIFHSPYKCVYNTIDATAVAVIIVIGV